MVNRKKYLCLITSILAVACCFSCKSSPSKLKKSTTTITAANIQNNDQIGFLYKGEDNFTVDWGDGSSEDANNPLHVYQEDLANVKITITGYLSEISFSNHYGPFDANNSFVEVTIGEGITTLPSYAFCNFQKLKSVFIPTSIVNVGKNAFSQCDNLVIYCKSTPNTTNWDDNWNPSETPCYWDYVSSGSNELYDYYISKKGAVITKYKDKDHVPNELTIPDKIGGKNVVGIHDRVFEYCYNIASVKLPKTIEFIGNGTFYYCFALATVTNMQNITTIGARAFVSCYGLTSLTLDSIISIGNSAFYECRGILTITLSNKLTSIGSEAFNYLFDLNEIIIPKSVEVVGSKVFLQNRKLTIYCECEKKPESWASDWNVDNRPCFWSCIKHGVEKDFCYVISGKQAIVSGYIGTGGKITIPEKLGGVEVKKIGKIAFQDNYDITSVKFPKTLEIIDDAAFGYCYNIESFDLTAFTDCHGNIPNAADNAFVGIPNVTFKVASYKMAVAFMIKGGGWPTRNADQYVY